MYLVILLNWVFCIFLAVACLSFIYLSLHTFMYNKTIIGFRSPCCQKRVWNWIRLTYSDPYPEPFLRAFDRARRGALAKSTTGYHRNMVREQYPVLELWPIRCQFDLIWIWPEPLVVLGRTHVRRALGTRMIQTYILLFTSV